MHKYTIITKEDINSIECSDVKIGSKTIFYTPCAGNVGWMSIKDVHKLFYVHENTLIDHTYKIRPTEKCDTPIPSDTPIGTILTWWNSLLTFSTTKDVNKLSLSYRFYHDNDYKKLSFEQITHIYNEVKAERHIGKVVYLGDVKKIHCQYCGATGVYPAYKNQENCDYCVSCIEVAESEGGKNFHTST